jgi:hypothetical protein
VLSAVLAAPMATTVRLPWFVVFGLGASLSLVVAATVTPSPVGAWGGCLKAIMLPVDPRDLMVLNDRMLNTWLFVPLGFFAGYAAVRRWWVLMLAMLTPLVVEGLQRMLPVLGRRCQFQDLIDNLWGVVLGAAAGIAVGFVVQSLPRPRD